MVHDENGYAVKGDAKVEMDQFGVYLWVEKTC